MKAQPPSNLELQILSILWEKGPLPARAIQESMPDGKKRAYTSVLSVMQVMEKKGLLNHETEGNRHVYKPAVARNAVLKPLVKNWVRNIFGGSPASAMQHFLENSEVNPEEINEMKKLLAEFENKSSKK